MELPTIIFIVVFIVIAFVAFICWCTEKESTQWQTAAEGEFERVEYGRIFTAIYFSDGSTIVISGERHSIPFSKGTKIKVERNVRGYHRVDKA